MRTLLPAALPPTGTLTATVPVTIWHTLDILVYVPPAVASTAPVDGATNVNYVGTVLP
ncbi:MAG: hypothetical protein U1F16_08165 [Turneriella sp.]